MAGTKNTEQAERVKDKIEGAILSARRVFLCEDFNEDSANDIITRLWYLDLQEPGKPIMLIINSPGGSVDAGFAIWDQIKILRSPVKTLVTGLAASMGSVLSLAGGKGNRFCTPYSRIMMHAPLLSGYMQGQATDLEIQAREILRTRDTLVEVYQEATGRSKEEIEKKIDRNSWMGAEEAKEFGLIDKVVSSADELAAVSA